MRRTRNVIAILLRRLTLGALMWVVAVLSFFATMAVGGCAHLGPVLGDVLGRVDVQRLWACRDYQGPGIARCMGLEAASQAVGIAADLALERLRRARELGADGAGASDHTEADRAAAAADLEVALAVLHREAAIAAAEAGPE